MQINDELISYVASLARLSLTEAEKEKTKKELGSILNYMDILNGLDTQGIEPMSHVLPLNNVFREDEVKASYPREELLANAPDEDDGAFRVPKTLE